VSLVDDDCTAGSRTCEAMRVLNGASRVFDRTMRKKRVVDLRALVLVGVVVLLGCASEPTSPVFDSSPDVFGELSEVQIAFHEPPPGREGGSRIVLPSEQDVCDLVILLSSETRFFDREGSARRFDLRVGGRVGVWLTGRTTNGCPRVGLAVAIEVGRVPITARSIS
jgi:hypothetical protein